MLINITFISDLPELKKRLNAIAESCGFSYTDLVNPTFAELSKFSAKTKIIFCNPNKINFRFDAKFFQKFECLEIICTASTGTIHIDMDAAEAAGVRIISIKTEFDTLKNVTSTADLALNLALTGVRKSFESTNDFFKDATWDFERYIGKQIKDLNVCVFGYGRLGKMFSNYMSQLGAEITIVDPKLSFNFDEDLGYILKSLADFDLISIHVHAEGNIKFFGNEFFTRARSDVTIVNTSRGEVIDEVACFDFLKRSPRARYITDVIADEYSLSSRQKYIDFYHKYGNLIVTQHIGGMSTGARELAFGKAITKLEEAIRDAT